MGFLKDVAYLLESGFLEKEGGERMKESPVCLKGTEGQGADGTHLKKIQEVLVRVALTMMHPSISDYDIYPLPAKSHKFRQILCVLQHYYED